MLRSLVGSEMCIRDRGLGCGCDAHCTISVMASSIQICTLSSISVSLARIRSTNLSTWTDHRSLSSSLLVDIVRSRCSLNEFVSGSDTRMVGSDAVFAAWTSCVPRSCLSRVPASWTCASRAWAWASTLDLARCCTSCAACRCTIGSC